MVGRLDQRFMFNNKTMKIGERKRNDMKKVVKENVGPNSLKNSKVSQVGKSHKELTNFKSKHLPVPTPDKGIFLGLIVRN